jgi:beta-phosphoglucomutase
MQMKIKGALFDMDGVVVDNHQYHFKAWMEFSRRHNFNLNKEIYRDKFNGKTNSDLFRMIFGDISAEDVDCFAKEKEGLYMELYSPHMMAHTGLVEFLEFLKSSGIKIALGTSAPTMNVDFTLDRLKLREHFEVIVDGPQVTKGKPDPEVYCLCASKLGLDPKECVVFEDALAGLDAGKAAGCQIVGVATSHDESELRPKTNLIIKDFIEAKRLLKL